MVHPIRRLALPLGLLLAASSAQAQSPPSTSGDSGHTLSWEELNKLPLPSQDVRFGYGKSPSQSAELRMPSGSGPFPVLVLVHGGCWQSAYGFDYMTRLAAWFAQRGVATWTIEYRRLDETGGGWPG